jgi:ferritin-like metal-binding protein YciE
MSLDSLKDLYIEQLQDLYSAENQILKALPDMEQRAQNHQLKDAFREHRRVTEEQVRRLDQIFDDLGASGKDHHCKGMEGLIKEGQEMIAEKGDADVIDAGLIAAAQRVEHYEIAGYGTVRTFAERLGHREHANLLQRTLDEEGETDKKLTRLAESTINPEAMR